MECSPNTWLDGVHHFGIPPLVLVQSGDLQHHRARGGRLINPPFIGGAREPGRMVIGVADIHDDPRKVALHRDILIPYLKESTRYGSCWRSFPSERKSLSSAGNLSGATGRQEEERPYHDCEHMLVDGFVVKRFRSVEGAGCRVKTKLLETQWIDTTLQSVD